MLSVFLYLTRTSFRNRLRAQAKRLRNPRYAIALIIGVAYLWIFLFRPQRDGAMPGQFFSGEGMQAAIAFVLLLLVLSWWVSGSEHTALAFTPAEVQFLFPAPVSRRGLIHYKLLRLQAAILLNTLIWSLILRRTGGSLAGWERAFGLWALFSALSLHRLGATLVRTAASQSGLFGAKRNVIAIAAYGLLLAAAAWSFGPILPGILRAGGASEVIALLIERLRDPVAHAVLAPFQFAMRPIWTAGAVDWWKGFLPVVGVLVLHYAWVVRTDAAFEEAAVAASAARARRIEAARARAAGGATTGKRRRLHWTPRLNPHGRPGTAIVWKNTVALLRTARVAPFIAVFVFIAVMMAVASGGVDQTPGFIAFVALFLTLTLVIMGARMVRNDLRYDMPMLGVMKTYPLRGRTVMLAEIISPVIVLTLVEMALLAFAYGALFTSDVVMIFDSAIAIDLGTRTAMLLAAPIVLAPMNAVTVTIQNGAALLFPAWIRMGPAPAVAGIEAMGQNILTVAASVILLGLSLIVPLIVGAGTAGILSLAIGDWAIIPGMLLGLLVMMTEVLLLLRALGRVYDRAEPLVAA